MKWKAIFAIIFFPLSLFAAVQVGIDVLVSDPAYRNLIQNKRVGLIANQSAVNCEQKSTLEILQEHGCNVIAVFAPEHGYFGNEHNSKHVSHSKIGNVPVFSIYGTTRRPNDEMLKNVDILIYDIQDIGTRGYTYVTTLFYCMEEAAKRKLTVIVLDRPNPMGGHIVDGLIPEDKMRFFCSYIAVPYCHGMTVGELALFFNKEYQTNCALHVVPMRGWKRGMSFEQTGLVWVPLSPQIPEADTPYYFATTGVIGHCSLLSIGIGYTLPFKIVGAPWVESKNFADALNRQNLPGVKFQPFYFKPFYGKYTSQDCQGVRIVITNKEKYLPFTTQYTIMGVLKSLYPKQFEEAMTEFCKVRSRVDDFHKLNGRNDILHIFNNEKFIIWKLRELIQKDRERFMPIRQKYLLYD